MIGLGCMRLSTNPDADEARGRETIVDALNAGIRCFDTARAYGENERLLAHVLKTHAAGAHARVVTKGGMLREGPAWVPDGRAKSIRADCEASLAALDGVPIDLYLLHTPDPKVPLETSVRALMELLEAGLVRRVGVSNVNRAQLDEALALGPISAAQVALGPFDDRAIHAGVVARCLERGIEVFAHSPFGGPKRASRVSDEPLFVELARTHGVSPHAVALAALETLVEGVVLLPGATTPKTASDCATASTVRFSDEERVRLAERFPSFIRARGPKAPASFEDGEVVLIMGLQGAGKTDSVTAWTERGYVRLNRDERGGTLADLRLALDETLAAGNRRVVLDNTFLTRASRSATIEVAWKHRVRVRGLWLDTPLAQAQVNVIERVLEVMGRLPEPEELKRAKPPVLAPRAHQTAMRELELPELGEGFGSLEMIPFVRRGSTAKGAARFISLEAIADENGVLRPGAAEVLGEEKRVLFTWSDGDRSAALSVAATALEALVGVRPFVVQCSHGGGPPRCWCRPPLPGLLLAFARDHEIDLSRSTVVGSSAAHRVMAGAVGATVLIKAV